MINTIKQANKATGGLSRPSKMPCPAYSIPAETCKTGAKLVNIEGSVCKDCYAMSGNYRRFAKTIKPKLYERYQKLFNEQWVEGMVLLINKQCKNGFFRWHDSGDVQSIEHIKRIVMVCKKTPEVMHWVPTREYKIVKQYIKKYGSFPNNLTVRLSAHMVEGKAPIIQKLPTSTVSANNHNCKAYLTDKYNNVHKPDHFAKYNKAKKRALDFGHCGNCRKCWNKSVKNITYKLH